MLLLASHVILWMIVGLQGVAITILLRQLALLSRSTSNSPALHIGEPAPQFSLPDTRSNRVVASGDLRAASRTVILFLSTDCGTCRTIARKLCSMSADQLRNVIVCCVGEEGDSLRLFTALPPGVPLAINATELQKMLSIEAYPAAVIIDKHGIISGASYVRDPSRLESILFEADHQQSVADCLDGGASPLKRETHTSALT